MNAGADAVIVYVLFSSFPDGEYFRENTILHVSHRTETLNSTRTVDVVQYI